jgi:threonine/homoserine/homoserine lactone efflux protein
MNTIFFVLWSICIISLYVGLAFSEDKNREKSLIGWALTMIGLIFNGLACLVQIDTVLDLILAAICFVLSYTSYKMLKKKQKEFDIKELGIKEMFLRDLREYKFKLDRKNHKIV